MIGCNAIGHTDVGIVAPEQIIDGFSRVLSKYLGKLPRV